MAQQTFENKELLSSIRKKLNGNAIDAEERLTSLKQNINASDEIIANRLDDLQNQIDNLPNLGYLPVSRALVPGVNAPTLSAITLGSGYLLDTLDYGGGSDESAYFHVSTDATINDLKVSVLVTSQGSDGDNGSISVGVAKVAPDVVLSGSEIKNATAFFQLDVEDNVYEHTFELTDLNIQPNELIILKFYRNGASDGNDNASEAMRLIKINLFT